MSYNVSTLQLLILFLSCIAFIFFQIILSLKKELKTKKVIIHGLIAYKKNSISDCKRPHSELLKTKIALEAQKKLNKKLINIIIKLNHGQKINKETK